MMRARHLSLIQSAFLRISALCVVGLLWAPAVRAQFIYTQDFKGTSASGWVFGSASSSPFSPVLTAAAGIDSVGDGWLRMTDLQANEATFARLTTPIPSANNNITVALDLAMWNQGGGSGAADGMTISLRDASVPFSPGAYGGSLGYANGHGIDGMAGGYFSLGIDNYGNFSNPTEDREGGIGFVPNAIATRGPGSGQDGYAYLGGTTNLANAPYSMGNLDFPNATSRPNQSGTDYRQLVFNLDSSSILTVSLKLGTSGTLTQIYTADLSGFARPENLELVYTGSTGGGQQINEIRSLVVNTTSAPVGNVYYSNYANDNKWGTGANWGDSLSPNLGLVPGPTANLIFSNNGFTNPSFQLTTAQSVDLQQNRTAASIQFDAPFNYTLQGHQLTLNNGASPTAITVTSAQPGGAHTIESNLVLGSDLNINTNTNTALVLSGNIAAGMKQFTLNNLGTTTFAGQITGSGTLTHLLTGTVIITGNSAATFTGNIDMQKGTLQLGASNVLNGATTVSLSSANGSGTFNLAGYNQTVGALNYVSGGTVTTGSGILSMAGNVTSSASATQAVLTGNLDLGSVNRVFSVAQGGANPDMAVSAAITSTGGGITKTGSGSLLLSGDNSFNGANVIAEGTVIASHSNALGAAATATTTSVSTGATLGLQGGININALEAIALNGTGDIGRLGALDNLAGDNSVAGAVTLTGNTRIGAAADTTLTVAGAIGQSGGARTLTANGSGTIVLGGTNTYSGTTTVNSSTTLVAAANGALGTTTGTTTVASGGTLGFQGNVNYSTAETVNVSGTGAGGRNGAIDNLSGNNAFAGNVAMAAATTIGANAGSELTLNGIVSGAQNLTVGGTGTIVLGGSAANSYSGTTTVNSGATVVAAKNSAFGSTAGTTTVNSGATLGFQGGVVYTSTEALTVSGTGAAGRTGAIENISGTNRFDGVVALAGSTTIATAAASELTLQGVVSGAQTLTKAGDGVLVFGAANTYSGGTAVDAGTLSLAGASGAIASTSAITVSNATLKIDNAGNNNSNRVGNTTGIALNDGTLTFLGHTASSSTESVGILTLGSGNSVLNVATGNSSLNASLTLGDIVRNGSSTLTINSYSDAAMTTRSTLGQGTAGSAGVFVTTDAFAGGTGPSLGGASTSQPIALPGWITTITATGGSEFVEYSGDAGSGNGIRPITTYTGAKGINVNDPTKVVELNASSTMAAWKLDVPGPTSAPISGGPKADRSGAVNGMVTVDGGLKLVDVATVDLNTDSSYTLLLKNGGLLKTGATATDFIGSGALTSGNNFLAVTVDNLAGVLNLATRIVDNGTDRGTTGALTLTKGGAGLLILGGTNTYTGNNFFTDGVVQISSEANLGAAGNDVTFSGGTLKVSANSFSTSANKLFTITAAQTGTFDIDAGVTLTLGAAANVLTTADANGTAIKNGDGQLVIVDANSSFDGTLRINDGTVQVRNAQSLGDATNRGRVTLAGGTLDLRNDAASAFSNNVTVVADSGVNVDRVSSGTNLTHTLGTLTMGGHTLTVSGGNSFDLAFGATALTGAATFNTTTLDSNLSLGAVSGAGSLTKTGAGMLVLTGANSYAGATNITGGTLRLGNGTALLPSGTHLTVGAGATFDQNGFNQAVASLAGAGNVSMSGGLTTGSGNTSTVFGGVISGAGGLTKTGAGTMTLSGANSFTGTLAINQGGITHGAANTIADSVTVTVAAAATLNLAGYSDTIGSLSGAGAVHLGGGTLTVGGNNATTSVTGVLSGTGGSLVKTGSGTMTLAGTNTYSGATTVGAGTLAIANSGALGAGDGTAVTGTTVASGATLQISGAVAIANEALTLNGSGTSGNGALQNVSGNNSVSGPVKLGSNASVAVNAGNLTFGNGVDNSGNTLTVGGTGNTLANGAITGSGGLVKTGAGALILNSSLNNFSGATTVTGGTIQVGVNGAGPANSAVTLAGGATLDVNSKTAAIGSLAGSAGSSVILGSGTLSAGGNHTSTAYAGVISGANGSFTKDGTGTLTLSGANTFTGATTVSAGSLAAGANHVLTNQTAVTVAMGATFNLANTTQAIGSLAGGGNVTLGSGQLVVGASNASTTYSGTMSGTGTFTKGGSGTLTITGHNTYTGATTITSGTLALGVDNALSNSTDVTINAGATLLLAGGVTDTINRLNLTATSNLSLGTGAVLTIDTAASSTLMGNIVGDGTLAYTGGGNLTLANNLELDSITLAFGGNSIGATPTSTLFVGNGTSIGTLHITGDTILDFGNSTASVLSTANLQIDAGVKISITNWVEWQDYFFAADWADAVVDIPDAGPAAQVDFDGWNTPTKWQSWDNQITPTPEPETYGLMLMSAALSGLGWRRWRKQRKAQAAG